MIYPPHIESVNSNEKNLDSTSCRKHNVALGTKSGQSVRLLHITSLGLLRDIRLPRIPSTRKRKARLGMGAGNHSFGLQPDFSGTPEQRVMVNHQCCHHRDCGGIYFCLKG